MSHTRLISVFTLSLVVILGSSPAAFSGVLDRLFRRKPADGTASVQAEAPATVSPLRKFGFVSHSLDGGQEEISGPGTCDSCQDCGPDDDCQECRWRCGHCKTFKCLWNRHIRRKHPIRSCYPVHPPYWTPHYGYYRTCWRRMGEGNSRLDRLPTVWQQVLKNSKGVYLLTCPKTKEQHVGSATAEQDYIQTGHGGNVALKSRDPSDYQASILEVAGTASTTDEIIGMEVQWKSKLQSREMGLNKN